MKQSNPSVADDALVRHSEFLRRLAQKLVFDRSRADDLVQQAWLTVLRRVDRRSPPESWSIAWLAGMVKNMARQTRRDDVRRLRREQHAAAPERLPSTVDTAGRFEVMRRVMDAVQSLDEPYRSVVLLRFYDGLPPREVARRMALSVNTVRTRLRRALEQLRARLDRGAGDRDRLVLALLPFAGARAALLSPAVILARMLGVIVMSSKVSLAAAAVVVVLLPAVVWRFLDSDGNQALPRVERTIERRERASEGGEVGANAMRTDVAAPPSTVDANAMPTRPGATAAEWMITGQVHRRDGVPGSGAVVRLWVEDRVDAHAESRWTARVTSDEQGRFSTSVPQLPGPVALGAKAEVPRVIQSPVKLFLIEGVTPPPLDLTLYPIDCTVAGQITDGSGRALADATLGALGMDLTWHADSEGLYRVELPSAIVIEMYAEAPAHARRWQVTEAEGPGSQCQLDFALTGSLQVVGVVTDRAGVAVPGVRVAEAGPYSPSALTDAAGQYSLDHLDPALAEHRIIAATSGFLVAEQDVAPAGRERIKCDFTLRRGGRLSGIVSTPTAEPVCGAQVRWSPSERAQSTVTRADGSFAFSALEPGQNAVLVTAPRHAPLEATVTIPDDGGEARLDVVLAPAHFVAGRVVDRDRQPLSRVSIAAFHRGVYLERTVSTDVGGGFRVDDLPASDVSLELFGADVARATYEVAAVDRSDLEVMVEHAGRIAGLVVDGVTNRALDEFRIRLLPAPRREGERGASFDLSWYEPGHEFAAASGRFEILGQGAAPGSLVSLEAWAPGYAATVVDRVAFALESNRNPLVVRLHAGREVHGLVLEHATGRPIAGATIKLCRSAERMGKSWFEDRHRPAARSGEDGRFTLSDVPPGDLFLRVECDGCVTAETDLTIDTGSKVHEQRIEVMRR